MGRRRYKLPRVVIRFRPDWKNGGINPPCQSLQTWSALASFSGVRAKFAIRLSFSSRRHPELLPRRGEWPKRYFNALLAILLAGMLASRPWRGLGSMASPTFGPNCESFRGIRCDGSTYPAFMRSVVKRRRRFRRCGALSRLRLTTDSHFAQRPGCTCMQTDLAMHYMSCRQAEPRHTIHGCWPLKSPYRLPRVTGLALSGRLGD